MSVYILMKKICFTIDIFQFKLFYY